MNAALIRNEVNNHKWSGATSPLSTEGIIEWHTAILVLFNNRYSCVSLVSISSVFGLRIEMVSAKCCMHTNIVVSKLGATRSLHRNLTGGRRVIIRRD